jgi:hypothetical protein
MNNIEYKAVQISDDHSVVFLEKNKIAITKHVRLDKFDPENPRNYIFYTDQDHKFDQIINLTPMTRDERFIATGSGTIKRSISILAGSFSAPKEAQLEIHCGILYVNGQLLHIPSSFFSFKKMQEYGKLNVYNNRLFLGSKEVIVDLHQETEKVMQDIYRILTQ